MGFKIENHTLIEYIPDDEDTDVVIPEGVTSIRSTAFRNTDHITSISFPSTLPMIKFLCWDIPNELKRIYIPDGVKVGKKAFSMAGSIISNIPIAEWNSRSGINKLEYALNYMQQYQGGDPFLDSVKEQNDLFIKEHTTEIIRLIMPFDIQAISYLTRGDFLNIYHIEYLEKFLNENIEITAMLLDYKASRFTPEFLEKHEQKKIDTALGRRERSLSEWKRIFRLRDDGSGGYIITGYKGADTDVEIPQKIGGRQVTAIGYRAFAARRIKRRKEEEITACRNIRSVYIPEGVTMIGAEAFACCVSLTEAILPSSLKIIGKRAFSSCYNLSKINLPEGLTQIEDNAFSDCGIPEITIPGSVKTIGKEAFSYCIGLKALVISSGTETIGKEAFAHCYSLTKAVIPEGVKNISYEAFRNCKSLTSVTLPGSVTVIPAGAFYECKRLKEINLPDTLVSIGKGAFRECGSLIKIAIPDSVSNISGCAFASCGSLSEIKLPAALRYLGSHAFYHCESLKSIEIPEGVTRILKYCFNSCTKLENVTLPDTLQSIDDFAFYACRGLTEITIPKSVVQIGVWAFGSCRDLTICAPRGSYAVEYAKRNSIPYKEIDQ